MLIPLTAMTLGLTLSACSGNGSSSSSSEETKTERPKASSTTKPSPKATKAVEDKTEAIVLGGCNNSKRTLTFINPTTNESRERGGIISTRYVTLATGQDSLFGCMGARTGAMERAAFNKDFTKLGVLQNMQDDESLAGYVTPSLTEDDEATSSMRDLSGVRPDDGGFGAKKQRSIPAFDPTTSNMLFVEKGDPGKLLSINPNIGETEDAKPIEVPNSEELVNTTNDDDALYFFPHSDEVQNDYRTRTVYSPDGKTGFAYGETNSNTMVYGDLDGGDTKTVDLPLEDDGYIGLEPVAYLSENSFMAVSGIGRNLLYRVTITGNGKTMSYEPILADTDGEIYDVTVSPDGKDFVFMLEKDDTTTLFTAKTDGKEQVPSPLRTLDNETGSTHLTVKILGWEMVKQ